RNRSATARSAAGRSTGPSSSPVAQPSRSVHVVTAAVMHLPLSMTPPSLGDASHSLSITYSDFRRPSVFRQQSCVLEARGSPLLFASGSGRAALGSLGAETATGT